jgi:hypothetical protein
VSDVNALFAGKLRIQPGFHRVITDPVAFGAALRFKIWMNRETPEDFEDQVFTRSGQKSGARPGVPKLQRNIERDREGEVRLQAIGWRLLVVWECELAISAVVRRASEFLGPPAGSAVALG